METSGKRQHIVPQQMISRFASEEGKLLELIKPQMAIGTKDRPPKAILFRDNYYKDEISDFDNDLLKSIEQKYAKHYAEITDKPWQNKTWSGEIGASFIDWVAAQLCRTTFFEKTVKQIIQQDNPIWLNAYKENPQVANNIMRSIMFEEYQDFLSRPLWKWRCLDIKVESNLVITDNPVCYALGFEKGRKLLLVPLSKKRILFGGTKELLDKCSDYSVRHINFSLAAWSERSIFAADRKTLKNLIIDLKGEGIIAGPQEILEAARKPFFGLLERVQSNPVPSYEELDKFMESLKNSFGPSILGGTNGEEENSEESGYDEWGKHGG